MELGIREYKAAFFDTSAVGKALNKGIKKALSNIGANIRGYAKSSIKYGDGVSPAGQPPTAHRSKGFTRQKKSKGVSVVQPSSPLRELIYFAYDPVEKTVVIGPALFGPGQAKQIERGGPGVIVNPTTGVRKSANFAAHPFMVPAMEAKAKNTREQLRGMVS